MDKVKTIKCVVCHKDFPHEDLTPYGLVTPNVGKLIKNKCLDWNEEKFICFKDLNHYRSEYIKASISQDQNEISEIEQSVILSLREHEAISENINDLFKGKITFGDKLSDKIAEFGGSWKFIIIFFRCLVYG